MKAARTPLILLTLAILPLAGCRHRVVIAAVPPPPRPEMISVPPPSHPSEPEPEIPLADLPEIPLPTPTVPRPPRRRPAPAAPAPAEPPTTAAVTPPPMDLGNLTTGSEGTDNSLRQQTDSLLQTQHRRLSGVSAATAALHTRQMEQTKLFLRQADEAWQKQDLEGARTLATKAKLLLDEILG